MMKRRTLGLLGLALALMMSLGACGNTDRSSAAANPAPTATVQPTAHPEEGPMTTPEDVKEDRGKEESVHTDENRGKEEPGQVTDRDGLIGNEPDPDKPDKPEDAGADIGDTVGEAAKDAGDTVGEAAKDLGDAAGDAARNIGETAKDAVDGDKNGTERTGR